MTGCWGRGNLTSINMSRTWLDKGQKPRKEVRAEKYMLHLGNKHWGIPMFLGQSDEEESGEMTGKEQLQRQEKQMKKAWCSSN